MRATLALFGVVSISGATVIAQPVYNLVPDWESADTPVSTGGALVDLDGDGWLDFVVANGNDISREELVVYYNRGQVGQGFGPTPDWYSSDTEYNGHISVADVNGDGWPDVAVGLTLHGAAAPTARVYLNDAGTLSLVPDWESFDSVAAFHVAFGDVNNDGRADLAVGTGWPYSNPHAWHNHVYVNVDGTLEDFPSWVSDDLWDYSDVFFADVNGDGWLDLVGLGAGTHTWVYLNNEGALETTASWSTLNNPEQFCLYGTFGDLNGDGWTDLVTSDNDQLFAGSGNFQRYDGLAGGMFTTSPVWTYFEGYASAVSLADVDADGDLDLATGGWWDRTRYFLATDGSFPAAPTWSTSGTSVVEAIVSGDVNNDGLRNKVEVFPVAPGTPRRLFQLAHQPIERITSVTVDGTALGPDRFTCDTVHGWVTVGEVPTDRVVIRYVYSLKPDMAVTNWDAVGNYLFLNRNDAPAFGDHDGDDRITLSDYVAFLECFSGQGTPADIDCTLVFDDDGDGDVDFADFAGFQRAFTGAAP